MVRCLARDTTTRPILFRRQLPPQMLLVDHLLRTSLFPLKHYVQRKGAVLEALYRISKGFLFIPSKLVMTSLLHFEEKVHRKDLAQAEGLPLLMPRLLSQILEHLEFPQEPRIERRIRCTQILSTERSLFMRSPLSSSSRRSQQMMQQRTRRGERILFLRWRWRWRGAQFQIHLLHLHLVLR